MEKELLKISALKNVKNDLIDILNMKEYRMDKITSKAVYIKIKGDNYYSEEEIIDAYGIGIISSTQKDNGLKKFREKMKLESIDLLNYESRILKSLIEDIDEALAKLEGNY